MLSYNSEVTTHALGVLSSYNLIFNCYPLFIIILGNTLKRQENSQKHCKGTDFYMIDEKTHEKPVQS